MNLFIWNTMKPNYIRYMVIAKTFTDAKRKMRKYYKGECLEEILKRVPEIRKLPEVIAFYPNSCIDMKPEIKHIIYCKG